MSLAREFVMDLVRVTKYEYYESLSDFNKTRVDNALGGSIRIISRKCSVFAIKDYNDSVVIIKCRAGYEDKIKSRKFKLLTGVDTTKFNPVIAGENKTLDELIEPGDFVVLSLYDLYLGLNFNGIGKIGETFDGHKFSEYTEVSDYVDCFNIDRKAKDVDNRELIVSKLTTDYMPAWAYISIRRNCTALIVRDVEGWDFLIYLDPDYTGKLSEEVYSVYDKNYFTGKSYDNDYNITDKFIVYRVPVCFNSYLRGCKANTAVQSNESRLESAHVDLKCIDGSYLDLKRVEDTQGMVDFYRNNVKTGDASDVFYERHLTVIETGLELLRQQLSISKDNCGKEELEDALTALSNIGKG